jgi:hypothetical protein
MAVGAEGAFSYFISKTTTVDPSTQNPVQFTPEDGDSEDVGFGDYLVGATCSLPKNGVVNDTYVAYAVDNGDGA